MAPPVSRSDNLNWGTLPTATRLQLARQPIFDRQRRVAGYELLYRGGGQSDASGSNAQERTARSMEALVELGLERLVGEALAFLNIDFDFIDCPVFDALPADRLVLEILEDTEPNEANLDRVRNLKMRGFVLAIDDYAFQPHLEPFLEFAQIIKLECTELDPAADANRIRRLILNGKCLLAEKIEEPATFEAYKALGCQMFQGFFFARPSLIQGSTVASNKASLMTFLARIHDEDISLREIEQIVSSDVTFTYKLLKLVHSAQIAAPTSVQTVGQAIMYLGLRSTAAIASVLALSAVDDQPTELLVHSLVRAKMCEQLARSHSIQEPETCFTLGLLSVLDAYLNRPMEEILDTLPLTPKLKSALLESDPEMPMRRMLNCVLAYERGDFDKVAAYRFDEGLAAHAYEESVRWADTTYANLRLSN